MLRFKPLIGAEGGQEGVIFGVYLHDSRVIGFYLAVKFGLKKPYHRLYWLPRWCRGRHY